MLVTMFTLDIDSLDYITYMIYALDICSTMGGWLSSDEPVTLESGFLIEVGLLHLCQKCNDVRMTMLLQKTPHSCIPYHNNEY